MNDSLGAAYGLASAGVWGAGDFSGGMAARRAPIVRIVVVSHGVGLVLLLGIALVRGETWPSNVDLGWGALAGLGGALGIAALYRGLAIGPMSLVAPIAAVLSAGVPVAVDASRSGLPGTLTLAGFLVAAVGVWLVSRQPGETASRWGMALAALAGLGFGAFLTLIGEVGEGAVFWPLAASRVVSFGLALAALLILRSSSGAGGALPWMAGAGVLDAGGNAFFVLAEQQGSLAVAAVLSSLYPAMTVILSIVILGERLGRIRIAGLVAVLAAIPLITLG